MRVLMRCQRSRTSNMRWQAVGFATLAVLCSINSANGKKRAAQIVNVGFQSTNDARRACECGRANSGPSSKIVGGTTVPYHEFPWMAMMLYNGSFLCGASLISDLYVLSAGHCLLKGLLPDFIKIRLGEHNMCQADSTTSTISVTKILRHPIFNETSFDGDILLMKLSMRISFSKYIRPICLPKYSISASSESRYEAKYATVVGWGKTLHGHAKTSCNPQKLKVPVLERPLCGGPIAHTLFCAGYLKGEGDACQGDSGGPLQYRNSVNRYELIGIVSNGIGCALPGKPGLYTDVLKLLPWIVKHSYGSNYCL